MLKTIYRTKKIDAPSNLKRIGYKSPVYVEVIKWDGIIKICPIASFQKETDSLKLLPKVPPLLDYTSKKEAIQVAEKMLKEVRLWNTKKYRMIRPFRR